MRTFTMYRKDVPDETHPPGTKNAPDEPQFQGVQFDDGTVVIRWMTAFKSTVHWDSMEDMLAVHGHPEYGSTLVWEEMEKPAAKQSLRKAHEEELEKIVRLATKKLGEFYTRQKRGGY